MPVGEREERVVGGDREIAGHREAEPNAGGRALYRDQDGFRHAAHLIQKLMSRHDSLFHPRDVRLACFRQRLVESLDVATGHEVIAGAAQHHTTHGRIALEPRRRLDQSLHHLGGQRIQRCGPIQRNSANVIRYFG